MEEADILKNVWRGCMTSARKLFEIPMLIKVHFLRKGTK
jgi:hypothetical protein